MALSRITEAVASFTDLTIGDDLTLTDDLLLASDAALIKFGADADVIFTHVADTGLLLNSASVIQFRDSAINIGSPADGDLDINADDEIELNSTLIDVNGNLDVSGTIVGASTLSATTITASTAFVPDASDGAALGTTALEFSDLFLADAAVIALGADQDVTLTHVADTGVLLNAASVVQFRDSAINIGSPADGDLDINADDEIELNSTLIDVNGNLDVSGTIVGASTLSATTITASTAFVPDASDGAALGTTALEFSDLFLADGAVISLGDDDDVTLTHVADTGILLNGANVIQFNDASQSIGAPSATVLDINATDEIELNATEFEFNGTTADINANLDVSGTALVTGVLTTTAATVFNGGFASNADSTMGTDKKIIFRDAAIHISSTADGDLSIAADDEIDLTSTLIDINGNATVSGTLGVTGIATFTDDIIIGDGKTIGSASDVDAITIGSDGDITLTQDLELQHDGAILSFGANDEISLTHVHDTGLLLNAASVIQFRDSAINIGSPADGDLDINADDEIELNSTLIDINGNVEISGTAAITGIATFTDDIIIGDGKTIGSASDVDAITIASTGVTTFSKAVVGATSTDTTNTGNVTLDFATFTNFVLTFTGNVTLVNPSTEVVGQSGFIVCIQDGTGSRTLSLGTDYETAGSVGFTLSTAANARDIIPYAVSAAGKIILGAVQKAFG